MADGRFVSKSIAIDWELNKVVSFEADYLFQRCVPHLDREGRLKGHPGEVKAITVPLRDEMTPEVIDRCLGELAAEGLVLWYRVGGEHCLWFRGFEKHQRGLRKNREAESKVPSQHHPKLQRLTTVLRSKSNLLRRTPDKVEVEGEVEVEVISSLPAASFVAREDVSPPEELRHGKQQAGKQRAVALDELVTYLGVESRQWVEAVARMPDVGVGWARGLLATYGPGGSLEAEMIPTADRPAVLATALRRYATDRKRWYGPGFKAFVSRAWIDMAEQRTAAEKSEREEGDREARREAAKLHDESEKRRLEEEGRRLVGDGKVDPQALVRQLAEGKGAPKQQQATGGQERARRQIAELRRREANS